MDNKKKALVVAIILLLLGIVLFIVVSTSLKGSGVSKTDNSDVHGLSIKVTDVAATATVTPTNIVVSGTVVPTNTAVPVKTVVPTRTPAPTTVVPTSVPTSTPTPTVTPVLKPDLAITFDSKPYDSYVSYNSANCSINANIAVINKGNVGIKGLNFNYGIRIINSATSAVAFEDVLVWSSDLSVNGRFSHSWSNIHLGLGTYHAVLFVDEKNSINELNEGNNTYTSKDMKVEICIK